jgi:parallel beta-helix repeat protein
VIAGNLRNGVLVSQSNDNSVQGNFVGTNTSHAEALGNDEEGIYIVASNNTIIGGSNPGEMNIVMRNRRGILIFMGEENHIEGNLISGNSNCGICLWDAVSTTVFGNLIGTDAAGLTAVPNAGDGIEITNLARDNTIGAEARSNLISGNGGAGISLGTIYDNLVQHNFIGTDITGVLPIGNAREGITVAGTWGAGGITGHNTLRENVVSANGALTSSPGIEVAGAEGTIIEGNQIGTSADGTATLPNNGTGIRIDGSSAVANRIESNLISGNDLNGIQLSNGTSSNIIVGNFIGTDVSGVLDFGNLGNGIYIEHGDSNTIGGTDPSDVNLISGNELHGISIFNGVGNSITGNKIGIDVSGTTAIGNTLNGVLLVDGTIPTTGNTISLNVISGNQKNGIELSGGTVTGTVITSNLIGTNADATATIPNAWSGVQLTNTLANYVGGDETNEANVVSGNGQYGVRIDGSISNAISGNWIGTNGVLDSSIGNTLSGIRISGNHNQIGGDLVGEGYLGNTVAFNGGVGVEVLSGTGNFIVTNSIFANSGIGIDLGGDGVTANDPGDGDSGANALVNFPVLTAATDDGTNTTVTGEVDVPVANERYLVQFFASDGCDPSNYGEGQDLLFSLGILPDTAGTISINFGSLPTGLVGRYLTATVTSAAESDSTSEFSNCVPVVLGVP